MPHQCSSSPLPAWGGWRPSPPPWMPNAPHALRPRILAVSEHAVVQCIGASGCRQALQGTCVMTHWQGAVGIQGSPESKRRGYPRRLPVVFAVLFDKLVGGIHAHIPGRGEGRGRWAGDYAAFAVLLGFASVSASCRVFRGGPSWGILRSWWLSTMGIAPSSLFRARPVFLLLRFCRFMYAHIPRRGEARGSRWGGLPAVVGVVLAVASVVLGFGGGFRRFRRPFAFAFVSAGRGRSREIGGGG